MQSAASIVSYTPRQDTSPAIIRCCVAPAIDPLQFPDQALVGGRGVIQELEVGTCQLGQLAAQLGTASYLATLMLSCKAQPGRGSDMLSVDHCWCEDRMST